MTTRAHLGAVLWSLLVVSAMLWTLDHLPAALRSAVPAAAQVSAST